MKIQNKKKQKNPPALKNKNAGANWLGLFIQLLEWEENEDTYEEETDQIHSLLRILTISLGKDHCFFVQKFATFYNTY